MYVGLVVGLMVGLLVEGGKVVNGTTDGIVRGIIGLAVKGTMEGS